MFFELTVSLKSIFENAKGPRTKIILKKYKIGDYIWGVLKTIEIKRAWILEQRYKIMDRMENPVIDPHLTCNQLVHGKGASALLWEEALLIGK